MKIELPLETWTELFGFVPRWQLTQLVSFFGEILKRDSSRRRKCHHQTIGDRQFVAFVQFFLHKCGEVTLGQLHIYGNGDQPFVSANGEYRNPLALAVVPMPENVKNFESILISNLDESIIAFLQKFQQKSLLDYVNLHFYDCPDLLQIMANFMPLFTTINSIAIHCRNSLVLDQFQSEYSELATPMFRSARILIAYYNCRDSWFCDWLHIPREDGKPRSLLLFGHIQDDRSLSNSHFIKHIKKVNK